MCLCLQMRTSLLLPTLKQLPQMMASLQKYSQSELVRCFVIAEVYSLSLSASQPSLKMKLAELCWKRCLRTVAMAKEQLRI